METGEVINEKENASRQPDGQVVQQFKSSQLNQPNSNPDHDRTGQEAVKHDRTVQPVVETGRTQTRSSDCSKSFNVEDKTAHERTVEFVVGRDASHEPGNEQ